MIAGGRPDKFRRAQWRDSGIGKIRIGVKVVGEISLDRQAVEQMVFGEFLARRRDILEIEHRADQALRRYRGPRVS